MSQWQKHSYTCLWGIHLEHERLIMVRQVQNGSGGKPAFELLKGAVYRSEQGFSFSKTVSGAATKLKLWMNLR